MRQQVQQDGFRYQSIGTGNEGLGSNDSCHGAQNHGNRAKHARQHFEERIQVFNTEQCGVIHVMDNPGALSQVVEHQTGLYKRPADIDVISAHMAHV